MSERKMTRAEFMNCLNQEDMCYVYYTDKKHIMHFISDNPADDVTDAECFTTSLDNALLMEYTYAEKLKFLCDYLFDNRVHHVVRIYTSVVWL